MSEFKKIGVTSSLRQIAGRDRARYGFARSIKHPRFDLCCALLGAELLPATPAVVRELRILRAAFEEHLARHILRHLRAADLHRIHLRAFEALVLEDFRVVKLCC